MIVEILKDRNIYPKLHESVFGAGDVKAPEVVYIAKNEDGLIFGFMSGNWNFDGSFFIEYAGILPDFRKKGYLRYLKDMLLPQVNYLTTTHNENKEAIKTLTNIGFKIIGCRYDGQFYVEWSRRVNHG